MRAAQGAGRGAEGALETFKGNLPIGGGLVLAKTLWCGGMVAFARLQVVDLIIDFGG